MLARLQLNDCSVYNQEEVLTCYSLVTHLLLTCYSLVTHLLLTCYSSVTHLLSLLSCSCATAAPILDILIEPKQSSEFAAVIRQFELKAKIGHGAIFFAVCRGKASEGIDFRWVQRCVGGVSLWIPLLLNGC